MQPISDGLFTVHNSMPVHVSIQGLGILKLNTPLECKETLIYNSIQFDIYKVLIVGVNECT